MQPEPENWAEKYVSKRPRIVIGDIDKCQKKK